LAQDDYYYEIQLTNKQLVFYFMAGAAGLILSFLAGVMVGRGVETAGGTQEPARPVMESKIVAEQPPAAPTAAPAPSEYSYPQRLESDRPEEGLERPRSGAAATPPTAKPAPTKATPAASTPAAKPGPAPASKAPAVPAATPKATATPPPPAATPVPRLAPASAGLPKSLPSSGKGFAVQVVALKDRASADAVVERLKGRGFPAYVVVPAGKGGGLFTVHVGVYRDRADAELVVERLRGEKFKPFIIKQ
jgi:cell division septation protein DedD